MHYATDHCQAREDRLRLAGGKKQGAMSAVTPERERPTHKARGPEKSNTPRASGKARKAPGRQPTAQADIGALKQAAEPAPDLTTRGTPRKRAPKGTFDKTAYQRELMRKRRAKS